MTDNNDFPTKTVLSDGSVYRVVPVETGVRAVRAWAEYPWPMSPAQALALRDRLGWTSSPTDEEMFTTDHDLEEKDASFTIIKREQTVASFNMSLTSRIPKNVMDEAVPITERAFDAYVEALTAIYGQGARSRSRGVLSVTWTLPSDTSVEIGTVGWVIDVDVDSPASNEAARGEAQYFDEIADENDVPYIDIDNPDS
ncbi:DUF6301 family protein [Actinomyces sp. oral taxon 448]|uniref:DUF6301 family protein n=1 Tax=Actinomyces sp. oral taxon 448 TaxID=712124 RepID=UPI0002D9AABE|nr:DUF6301 family protein [Actinomyces sp. oral taxon 448]